MNCLYHAGYVRLYNWLLGPGVDPLQQADRVGRSGWVESMGDVMWNVLVERPNDDGSWYIRH